MEKRWRFDLAMDDTPAKTRTMDDLMAHFSACRNSDPEEARAALEEACSCGHIPAKMALASYLVHTPNLALSQSVRYARAERLLREMVNLLDVSEAFTARVAVALAHLYSNYMDRPIGALGYLLMAKEHGAYVQEDELKALRKKLTRMDVNHFGGNCQDAYTLGIGLLRAGGAFKMAEFFLREAADQSAQTPSLAELHGRACLALADLYDARRNESDFYLEESRRYYREARRFGHALYIRKPEAAPRTTYCRTPA